MTAHFPLPMLPRSAGIGLRAPHTAEMIRRSPSVGWLEVHAENYMSSSAAVDDLEQLRHDYSVSIHGVGLSLGSANGIDPIHLARLKAVVERFEPAAVSEHVAWSVSDGIYLNNLLPVPFDDEALRIVAENILRTQDALRRPIMIENLSSYVGFARSTMAEPEFLAALVRKTGCGLLLDINNVYVSAHNVGFDARDYIAALPAAAIGEMHLAGHAVRETPEGTLLIDDHASRVAAPVWQLYADAMRMVGPRPTLIEWDDAIPPLDVLLGEAMRAGMLLNCHGFDHLARDARHQQPKPHLDQTEHKQLFPALLGACHA